MEKTRCKFRPGEKVACNVVSLKGFEAQSEKGVKMSLQLRIEETLGYLAAKFTGVGAPEEVWRQYELIAEHCKRANKNKLLLELSEAHGEVSLVDRFFLGDEAQIFARYGLKVAIVYSRPDPPEGHGFGEMVARNRWIDARLFTNFEDAEEWLLK